NNGAANGNDNGFVTELNPAGTGLTYSTYLGGSEGDFGGGIALDGAGDVYVVGQADSFDFPITSDAFQTVNQSGQTAVVAKFAPAATTLIPTSTAVTTSGSPAALNATVVFTAAVTPLSGNGI